MSRFRQLDKAAPHLLAIREQKISVEKCAPLSGVPVRRLRYWRALELKKTAQFMTHRHGLLYLGKTA